jgi:hypothetical protein
MSIANSNDANITCVTGIDTQGHLYQNFSCDTGYYFHDNVETVMDECRPCTPIPNSNNEALYCSTATLTRGDVRNGFKCNPDYYPIDSTNLGLDPTQCVRMLAAALRQSL